MALVPNGMQLNMSVEFQDIQGRPAPVEGVPVWASSDETFFTIVDITADGLNAKARHMGLGGAPGQVFQATVTADADLGAGIRNIVGMLELEAGAPEAVVVLIAAGALEPIPPAPAP